MDNYIYKIEVRVSPSDDGGVGRPYFWTVYKINKYTLVKTTHGSDWAATPEQAFAAARKKVAMCQGKSTATVNVRDVFQPVYQLSNGSTYIGDVFDTYEAAESHSSNVKCIADRDGEYINVLSSSIQKRRLIL